MKEYTAQSNDDLIYKKDKWIIYSKDGTFVNRRKGNLLDFAYFEEDARKIAKKYAEKARKEYAEIEDTMCPIIERRNHFIVNYKDCYWDREFWFEKMGRYTKLVREY